MKPGEMILPSVLMVVVPEGILTRSGFVTGKMAVIRSSMINTELSRCTASSSVVWLKAITVPPRRRMEEAWAKDTPRTIARR